MIVRRWMNFDHYPHSWKVRAKSYARLLLTDVQCPFVVSGNNSSTYLRGDITQEAKKIQEIHGGEK